MREIERRSGNERRSGLDRRQAAMQHPQERRYQDERRWPVEHRAGYARVNQWKSVLLGIDITENGEIIAFR